MLQQTKDAIKVSFEKVKAHQLAITTIVNHIKKQVGKDMPEIKQLVDANWKEFMGVMYTKMPHYVDNNGLHLCDWVECKDESKVKTVCKEFLFNLEEGVETFVNSNGEIVCTNAIITKRLTKAEKMILTDEAGNEYVVSKKDEEGKVCKHEVDVRLCPRDKSVFGYTDDVLNAFIATIEYFESK